MDELPEELTSDRRLILQLLEKRRGKLKEKILAEHPEVLGTAGTAQKETGRTAGETESGSRSEVETLERGTSQRLISLYSSQILINSCITAEGLRSFFQARRILVFSFSSSMMRIGRSVQRSSMDLGKTAVARPSCTQSMASLGSSQTQKISGLEIFFSKGFHQKFFVPPGK